MANAGQEEKCPGTYDGFQLSNKTLTIYAGSCGARRYEPRGLRISCLGRRRHRILVRVGRVNVNVPSLVSRSMPW